jgi:hypothetical protein
VTAVRFVVDSLTTINPEWRRIILAVILASSFQVLSTQIFNFLQNLLLFYQNPLLEGIAYAVGTVLLTLVQVGSVFTPAIFGFWASLSWPGKHFLGYTALGLSAGVLNIVGGLGLNLLWGALSLPTGGSYPWLSGFEAIQGQWPYYTVVYLVGPAAVFTSAALFGDLAKWEAPPLKREALGLTYRLLDYFFKPNKEPNKILVRIIQTLQATLPLVLSALFSSFVLPKP